MTHGISAFRPLGWTAALALMMMLWTGCDAGSLASDDPSGSDTITTLAAMDFVDAVEMTVVNPGSAKEEQFILEISMNESAAVRYPEAFHVFGMRNDGTPARMEDSGRGGDAVEGDGIYSARVDRSCLEDDTVAAFAGKDIIKFTLSCEVDFIAPGEECEGEGVCPESASRSFLWGLIEYETDVVTCWCFQGCSADVEFSLGKNPTAQNKQL